MKNGLTSQERKKLFLALLHLSIKDWAIKFIIMSKIFDKVVFYVLISNFHLLKINKALYLLKFSPCDFQFLVTRSILIWPENKINKNEKESDTKEETKWFTNFYSFSFSDSRSPLFLCCIQFFSIITSFLRYKVALQRPFFFS